MINVGGSHRFSPTTVLIAGALILALSLGIRHGFGLFLQPMSEDQGWGREEFALAIAIQNLVWGAAQPLTGMLADRIGAGKAIVGGAVLYGIGLLAMAYAATPLQLSLSAGLLIGLGLSGTSFAVVFGAVSRAVAPERRSLAMGIASAVGSFGQFAMVPGTLSLIAALGWSAALIALAALAVVMVPLATAFAGDGGRSAPAASELGVRDALAEACAHRGFWLLSFGFFVCGFQVVFIALHLPAYLFDRQLPLSVGTTVLALVGLFNVAGTYLAGLWGGRMSKPVLLASIYALRAVAIALFVLLPISTWSAYAFGIVIGLLWLSTVPLTNGTVLTLFGVRNMSMLAGIVFLFHQVGAFFGGWLGGSIYDATGSYDIVWAIAIGLSIIAALLNLPIKEVPVARLKAHAEAA